MGNLNYYDRVRYTLFNKNQGSLIIEEPVGWRSDEKELARHEQYHGILSRFSNSSKYIGSGKEFIQLVYDIEGINADIKLIREEKHPQTDEWTLTYSGYLDLSTYEKENNQVSIKFNSGGLEQVLKAKETESVEIDRTTTIDGKTIPDLVPITVPLDGRRIFLKSKFETKSNDNSLSLYCESNGGNTRDQTAGMPLALINRSHEQVQDVLSGNTANENVGTTGMMFFANSDKKRTLHIKTNFTFKFDAHQDHIDWSTFSINLTKFKNGVDYNTPTRIPLFSLGSKDAIGGAIENTYSINYEGTIDVESGESLAIEAFEKADFKVSGNAKMSVNLSNITGSLFVEEDSFHEKSTTNAVLAHELMDRLVTIATGQENAFYSELLGRTDLGYAADGPGSLIAGTHGFWIRQFDKLPLPAEATATTSKIENLFKPLTTSVKDVVTSLDAVLNVGIGIETIGNKERVRMEDLAFFYNNNVTIRLPNQVKKVKRSVATEYYYSSLEFGSEKGGTYEEAMGLDEYNTKSNYTTVINRLKGTYTKISKFRTDNYGPEFARRKPKSLNDTEDTPYDNDNFLMDLKRGLFGMFEQRKWQDDFEKEPTGVFDPSSATNLRFSPFNCMIRHSWWFGGGFKKYLTDYVRYGSSVANSQLKTKFIGKPEYAENGNIINSELMRARFFPEWIEFEHACNFKIMQMVEGKTVIRGKEIMNFYGLVEFINEDNEKEKGFLFNLKPNGKGQWKLLKSNR